MKFDILDELGKKVTCNMLFCFKNQGTSYIVYTNGHRTKGVLDVYASRYSLINNAFVLRNIEEEYEWNIVDRHLANYFKEA